MQVELRPLEGFLFVHGDEFAAATASVAVVFSVFGHGSAYSVEEEVSFRGLVERLRLSSEVAVVVAVVVCADEFGGFGVVGFAFDDLFHGVIRFKLLKSLR